jgi:transposase
VARIGGQTACQLCGPRGQGGGGSPAAHDPDARRRLSGLSGEFAALYSHLGRPSIPPERLLRALLLQAFYSVRSERLLMEQLDYNLLYRWFVGLGIDDPVWHPTAFTTNRDRLLAGDVAAKFLAAILSHPRVRQLLSREHFTVDGTLVEAWASRKELSAQG